jgi:hypothetical protein
MRQQVLGCVLMGVECMRFLYTVPLSTQVGLNTHLRTAHLHQTTPRNGTTILEASLGV